MANTAAEDSLATAEEEAAAEVPEATPAEEAMAPAVTVPEEVDTATRRILPRICLRNCHISGSKSHSFFFISLCVSYNLTKMSLYSVFTLGNITQFLNVVS